MDYGDPLPCPAGLFFRMGADAISGLVLLDLSCISWMFVSFYSEEHLEVLSCRHLLWMCVSFISYVLSLYLEVNFPALA